MESHTDIIKQIQEHGVRLIRAVFAGPDGVIRAKAVTPGEVIGMLSSGIGLARAQTSITAFDTLPRESAYQPVGEIRIAPDPGTFVVLPYLKGHARMLADLVARTGEPWELCPRSLLKKVLNQLDERGFVANVAFENEFMLFEKQSDTWEPLSAHPSFSSLAMDRASEFILDVIDSLHEQGIDVEKFYAESGPGQFELPIRHQPGLVAADQQVVFRETLGGVAFAHGKRVSFMPKPFPQRAGNGCHIHLSLSGKDQCNAFYDEEQSDELSLIGRHFVAGVLEHLEGLLAFTAPTINSYERFVEGAWASCFRSWGLDNREATVRVASSFSQAASATLNIEYRAADPTCNPYLALAALLIAGLSGLDSKLDPGLPALKDPAQMEPDERKGRNITRYPTSLSAALDALEDDHYLVNEMGVHRVCEYLTMKRQEIEIVKSLGKSGERDAYLFRF
jgi:glutamine synthetase